MQIRTIYFLFNYIEIENKNKIKFAKSTSDIMLQPF